MLHNLGDGTFESLAPLVTNAQNAWSSSLAWADLDYNGQLDLYVAHYVDWSWNKHPRCAGQGDVPREVCAPKEFAGIQDVVYFNDGQLPPGSISSGTTPPYVGPEFALHITDRANGQANYWTIPLGGSQTFPQFSARWNPWFQGSS